MIYSFRLQLQVPLFISHIQTDIELDRMSKEAEASTFSISEPNIYTRIFTLLSRCITSQFKCPLTFLSKFYLVDSVIPNRMKCHVEEIILLRPSMPEKMSLNLSDTKLQS